MPNSNGPSRSASRLSPTWRAPPRGVPDSDEFERDRSGGASTDYVQSLARGLSVIKAFDAENPRRT
ncbi:hypothetical protein GS425_16635, partial [Rhodococcus hoagii]|nr:hypothetical protein [Prescottella equi]